MKHLTASTSPSPFSGENWFDPLEDAIRFRVRAFIEAVVAEEAQAALGGRARYQRSGAPKGYRNGHLSSRTTFIPTFFPPFTSTAILCKSGSPGVPK